MINDASRAQWEKKYTVETEATPRLTRPDEMLKARSHLRLRNAITILNEKKTAIEDNIDKRLNSIVESIDNEKWKVTETNPAKKKLMSRKIIVKRNPDVPMYDPEFVH